jgi:lipopolysaccharide transport system ATP-binding protein
MALPIITIRNLGKRYRLGAGLEHDTLRDHLAHAARSFASFFLRNRPGAEADNAGQPTDIWALKDVSFDVHQGEVVGVIGRNGAGKSTLLKILSQITEPTEGEIRVKGRVSSLLEVGTGFHPELTGRENVFLNGAILGMTRQEVKNKFDEIVAFAEVDKFLDTPVKRYSSGMYVRLAFAVSAHLEPEVLVVDEVLAVGDIQFQKKCLGKMADVSRAGRTILFVSHNLAAVQKLCKRAILLEQGVLRHDGSTENCIARYLNWNKESQPEFVGYSVNGKALEGQSVIAPIRITRLEMFDLQRQPLQHLGINAGFSLRVHYECHGKFARGTVSFAVSIKSHLGLELCRLSTMPISGYVIDELGRIGYLDLTVSSLPLVGGRYLLDLVIFRPAVELILQLPEVVVFDVAPTDIYGSGIGMDQTRGLLAVNHQWHHQIIQPKHRLKPEPPKPAEV